MDNSQSIQPRACLSIQRELNWSKKTCMSTATLAVDDGQESTVGCRLRSERDATIAWRRIGDWRACVIHNMLHCILNQRTISSVWKYSQTSIVRVNEESQQATRDRWNIVWDDSIRPFVHIGSDSTSHTIRRNHWKKHITLHTTASNWLKWSRAKLSDAVNLPSCSGFTSFGWSIPSKIFTGGAIWIGSASPMSDGYFETHRDAIHPEDEIRYQSSDRNHHDVLSHVWSAMKNVSVRMAKILPSYM